MLEARDKKRIENYLPIWCCIVLCTMLLSACSKKKFSLQQNEVQITLHTSRDVNPNQIQQPAPIRVFLYELKEVDRFQYSDYFSLVDESNPQLINDVAKKYEFTLRPNESRTLHIKLSPGVSALGVVATYRNISYAGWRQIYGLPKLKKEIAWYKKIIPKDERPLSINVFIGKLAILKKENGLSRDN